ncbi:MAG: 4-hydroxy-tetrahydrodipicolinate synthase [Planctomycetota bacterium]|jgi:4-hydroxy-tetrahydrodipicolinate synthase
MAKDSPGTFKGSLVAIVTPFADGELDLKAFSELVEWQVASGTAGIVVSGTTGEAATLHGEEREILSRRALDVAKGRCPVVVGTGTNATAASVELSRAAAKWGVHGLLVVTPYYNKPTQEGLYRHFEAIAAAAKGVPVIAYDVPGRTGVTIEEETVHRIAKLPGVTALKDATHDVERAHRLAAETSLDILSGDDASTLPLIRGGATGVISVAANVVPDRMARLVAEQDEALHETLLPLFRALFVQSNPIPLKFALSRMGRIRNELRLPLVPIAEEYKETVVEALRAVGAI